VSGPYSGLWAECEAERRAEWNAAVERHHRLMQLAAHNGYRPDTFLDELGAEWWRVPPAFVPIVGTMVAVVGGGGALGQLTRWGFDRAAGAKARPLPLVRPMASPRRWPYRDHRSVAQVMAAEVAADEASCGAAVLAETGPPPPTRKLAARAAHTPQGRKPRPAGAVAEEENSSTAHRAVRAAPDPLKISRVDEGLRTDSFGLNQATMVRPPVVIDRERLAAALRARKIERSRPVEIDRESLPMAMSREECLRCGIPGFKGCDHQRPYEEPARVFIHAGRGTSQRKFG
jgi:hypothetical protein